MTIHCRATSVIKMPIGENIRICLAKREHLPTIAKLEQTCFAEPWSEKSLELLLKHNNFALVAMERDTLVGYCGVVTALDEGQITNIAVDPSARRRGVGRALMLAVMEEARRKRRDLVSLSLEVRVSNEAAISLYTSCGFRRVGERKNFYRFPTESAAVMLCDLSEI